MAGDVVTFEREVKLLALERAALNLIDVAKESRLVGPLEIGEGSRLYRERQRAEKRFYDAAEACRRTPEPGQSQAPEPRHYQRRLRAEE